MSNIKFVMEQHVGMRTFYKNMRQVVENELQLSAEWVEVNYTKSLAITEKLSPAVNHWLGTGFGAIQARRGLNSSKADVAFYCTQVPALLAGNAIKRTPYVLSTDITPLQYDAWADQYNHLVSDSSLLRQYKFARNRSCFQGAARVIAWSTWAAESLISDYHVDPDRIEVIPPGVDLNHWTPSADQAEGVFHILFVGSDFKRKGGDKVLAAFKQLPANRFQLHLVTQAKVEAYPGVHVYSDLTPNSPELLALYQKAHVYVHPAQAEAYSTTAVEAAATGLPVIATRTGGLGSVVDDGVTGFLLDEATPARISELILSLEQDDELRSNMGFAARRRAEQFYGVRANVRRALAILRTAAVGQTSGWDRLPSGRTLPKRALA